MKKQTPEEKANNLGMHYSTWYRMATGRTKVSFLQKLGFAEAKKRGLIDVIPKWAKVD